jgi:DNA-binding transcriptional ArsR family regulator
MINPMVDHSLDSVFHALADPTRRAILGRLALKPATITQLADPFSISTQAVHKHVGVLAEAELITRERRGRTVLCRANPGPLLETADWLSAQAAFWSRQLDSLERHVLQGREGDDRG